MGFIFIFIVEPRNGPYCPIGGDIMRTAYIVILILFACSNDAKTAQQVCMMNDRFDTIFEALKPFKMERYAFWKNEYNLLRPGEEKTKDLLIKYDDLIEVFWDQKSSKMLVWVPCCDLSGDAYLFYKGQVPQMLIDYLKPMDPSACTDFMIKQIKVTSMEYLEKKLSYPIVSESKYFITKKGITLGDSPSKVIGKLGPPESKEIISKKPLIIRYKWENFAPWETEAYEMSGRKTPPPPEKICPDIDEGQTIIIDFLKTKKGEEAIFIYIDDHSVG